MEILLRLVAVILNLLGYLLHPLVVLRAGFKTKKLPPLTNELLNIPAIDLATSIRVQEIKSEDVVRAYIERIKVVNQVLNAVVEDRFQEAIKDAKRADNICQTTNPLEILNKYPLLGVPFTVKESCGLKGLSFVVGTIPRKGEKAPKDGEAVERLRQAGAIPLLVSANPEYCLSWETNTLVAGRCYNPYDVRRTPGGSSGGEAALNAAGASLFGVGSDIAGSIRIPALFSGLFGHKPTGGLVSTKGHFPNSSDDKFAYYLQVGPLTRFARDLPMLVHIMAGENASKLNFDNVVKTKDIKIFYLDDSGPTFTRPPVDFDIRLSIMKAVEYFNKNGLATQKARIDMQETIEMGMCATLQIEDRPDMLTHPDNPKVRDNVLWEMAKHLFGNPKYSFNSLFFVLVQDSNGFMSEECRKKNVKQFEVFRQQFLDMLGTNGVLFYPTYHSPAIYHNTSLTNVVGSVFSAIFNVLGFPATHVPMGLNKDGLPIGFQIVAAPYQDRLCLTIAGELEAAFGGWVPPK